MKANELRIGNYVDVISRSNAIHLPMGIVKMIGNISFFEVELYYADKPFARQETPKTISLSDLSGIELNEEWLFNFGFKNKGSQFFKDFIGMQNTAMPVPTKFHNLNYWVVILFDQVDGQGYPLHNTKIKYVHQLQNLYFALTGEELRIKETING